MISKVSAHESGGGQRVPSAFRTVSFAQKGCFSKVLARFLGNHQDHVFWQAHFAQKACFIKVPARFAGALFFGKLMEMHAKSHAK